MLGIYRTTLALCVVISHFGGIRVGGLAVAAFFCLSGFLMTLLMQETYRDRIGAFALNRFLRLFPTYWAMMLLTLALILWGLTPSRRWVGIPEAETLLLDFLYIVWPLGKVHLVPSAWAVTIELLFYALIALGISSTKTWALAWLGFSVAAMAAINHLHSADSYLTYFSPFAGSVPFALGATLYHFRDRFPGSGKAVIAASALGAALFTFRFLNPGQIPHYLFLASMALLVVTLYHYGKKAPPMLGRIDQIIGHASYPIYLNHYAAAMLVNLVLPLHATLGVGIAVAAASVAMAAVSHLLIDSQIEKLRTAIRQRIPSSQSVPSGSSSALLTRGDT